MAKNRSAALRSWGAGLCLTMSPIIGVFAAPDSADVEEVTVTATRAAKSVIEAPATVSVISSESIERELAQDIKDLVRFEPGVSVRSSPARFTAAGSSTGRDGHSGFNIRGLEGNRVLIQVDGVRTPDAYSFGAQSVGRGDYVDLDILKSVEIVRGPASALYGSDGLAGSVSFITKDPEDLLSDGRDWSLNARAGYASSDESYSESLVGALRIGRWETLLAYTRRDGEGQKTRGENASANSDRTVPNPEDNASNSVLAKAVFTLNDSNRLRFTWDHMDRDIKWDVLSAIAKPPLTAASTLRLTAFDDMRRDRMTIDHLFESASGPVRTLRTALYYQDSGTRQFSSEDRNTAADRTRDNTFDNVVRGAVIEFTSKLDHGRATHELLYGADYSTTRQESLRDGTVPPAGETFPTHAFPTTDYTLAGIFVQDAISIGDRITLYPALRWDYFKIEPRRDALFVTGVPARQSDSHLTPKLGLLVRLSERVNAFANAAAGFKSPTPSQVNNGFTNPIQFYRTESNPDLDPETSRTIEAGVRFNGSRWSGSLAAYTGEYDDFIEQVLIGGSFAPTDPGVFQFINLAKVEIRGVEARGRWLLPRGFAINAAASYARGDSEVDGVETALASIDPFKLVSGLSWEPEGSRFGAHLYATYSAAKETSRVGLTCTPSCFTPESFTVFDALAWWKLTDHAQLRAGLFNLTDEKYWWWGDVRGLSSTSTARDAYSQPGRNASVSLSVRF